MGLAGFLLGGTALAAASFDCATAPRPMETIICGDPHHADLDAALADEARTALVHEQRDWLKGLIGAYAIPAQAGEMPEAQRQAAATCLTGRYQERLTALTSTPSTTSAGTSDAPLHPNFAGTPAGTPVPLFF